MQFAASVQNLRERVQQKYHLNLDDVRSECITITFADEGSAKVHVMTPEEMAKVPQILGSLDEAIKALDGDNDFLLKGDVFTSDFIDMWIANKRKEHDALRLRPHPYEFFLYYDV